MNKRVGAEALTGLGGGSVSDVSRRNLEIAEDLCRRRRPNEAVPYLEKALEADSYNLDAHIQLAFISPDFPTSIEVLESAEEKGRVKLVSTSGLKCFDDDGDQVGQFWYLVETRPYMRVMSALVRFYTENKNFAKAARTIIEMLRLCPGGNQGKREWLSPILLKCHRVENALYFAQNWLDPDRPAVVPRGGCDFQTPSKEPLPKAKMEKMSYVKGNSLYDGALAAFKLWGNCVLARQYLLLATKLNPHILLKILAKTDHPKELNRSARSLNSPEDANDYLWLAQDLWMKQDVWDWANSQDEVKNILIKSCSREGCTNKEKVVAEFKRCSACHQTRYCGQDCQKADWKTHKPGCKEHQQFKATIKAMTEGRSLPKNAVPVFGASADFSAQGVASKFYDKP